MWSKNVSFDFQIPLGEILAIPPFNYIVNLIVSEIAPVLIAANSIVLKRLTQVFISVEASFMMMNQVDSICFDDNKRWWQKAQENDFKIESTI